MTRDTRLRAWEARWTETRRVSGVVWATSKTDAAKRIREGQGTALRTTTPSCTAPTVDHERPVS